jgi:predicted alpha/beta superfamily hydrolase
MPQPTPRKSRAALAPAESTPIAGGVLWLHELRSAIFANTRLLRVWLPPQYDATGATRYPVLYLNDGQNLFEPATAFAGVHWAVGETASRLIGQKKIPPLIVVGIDNTRHRAREYVPYRSQDPKVFLAKGKCYPDFLRHEVMPLIKNKYPILAGAENTGLGGSSLGGLITLFTQLAAPGVFGKLLIESPSLFVANRRILDECRQSRNWPPRVYLGVGTHEAGSEESDERTVAYVRELESILRQAGLDKERLRVRIDEGATHTESAWAARFPEALEFLFGENSR